MALGVLLMLGMDEFTPHQHETTGAFGAGHERYGRAWLFVFAIALHNLPEGMAIGVGFLVGFAMRQGKGIRPIFGIIGAALALISCVMGDFFSIVGLVAKEYEVSFMDVLFDASYGEVMSVVIENMASMTIVFYGIALYEGYKLSFSAQKAPEGGKI